MANDIAHALAGDGSALLDRSRGFSETFPGIVPPAAGLGCADSPAMARVHEEPLRRHVRSHIHHAANAPIPGSGTDRYQREPATA
jgi:hypothetical protein